MRPSVTLDDAALRLRVVPLTPATGIIVALLGAP
ncbi:hypothetical protein QE394_001726 [Arthrobacter sp. SORGH_AS 212]|nr:hypothetical protein [Arthrobacter sp. SORGH_AS_0212]